MSAWAAGITAAAAAGRSASGALNPAPPSAAGTAGHAHQGIAGQISAINGSTWTVTTARGIAFTVTLTPFTAYGPATANPTR